jgi:hypothetical protein
MPLIFAYGTLQQESVQLSTVGRVLRGERDELPGWAPALVGYEAVLLRELGYGEGEVRPTGELPATLAAMDRLAGPLQRYLLADRRGDVMAARARLRDMLGRIDQ